MIIDRLVVFVLSGLFVIERPCDRRFSMHRAFSASEPNELHCISFDPIITFTLHRYDRTGIVIVSYARAFLRLGRIAIEKKGNGRETKKATGTTTELVGESRDGYVRVRKTILIIMGREKRRCCKIEENIYGSRDVDRENVQ